MPLARQRDSVDVVAILESSEGDHSGHAISRHLDITNDEMNKRVVDEGKSQVTRFSTRTDLVNATLEAMNSGAGQAALALIDAGAVKSALEHHPVAGNYYADSSYGEVWSFPGFGKLSHGSVYGNMVRSKVTHITIVFKRPLNGNFRIITSYPSGI